MPQPRRSVVVLTCAAGLVLVAAVAARQKPAGSDLPASLSNPAFWALSQESSEPDGYFRNADITNLTSNEAWMQHVIPDLLERVKPGGAYLGVGPEQNFTYMAAVRPEIAVIFDIRRGNLDLQLMYKALFELAADRAEFVSLLFAKPRPAGLGSASSVSDIFKAFADSGPSRPLYEKTLAAMKNLLLKKRGLPVPARDVDSIEAIYQTFFASGYYLRTPPSYWDLMTATDAGGVMRSYLASEAAFAFLKDLQSRNLVVPVVGDFGGPKAIRAIGQYLKARGSVVGAFYLSNVEQYLRQDGKWAAFCANVAALPLAPSSTFIRSSSGFGGPGGGRGRNFVNSLGSMLGETEGCRK